MCIKADPNFLCGDFTNIGSTLRVLSQITFSGPQTLHSSSCGGITSCISRLVATGMTLCSFSTALMPRLPVPGLLLLSLVTLGRLHFLDRWCFLGWNLVSTQSAISSLAIENSMAISINAHRDPVQFLLH